MKNVGIGSVSRTRWYAAMVGSLGMICGGIE